MMSSKKACQNSWKQPKSGALVIGALEIPSQPDIDIRGKYSKEYIDEHKQEFKEALAVWNKMKLKKEFISACISVTPTTTCFGTVTDMDATLNGIVADLNAGWVKNVNNRLEPSGFSISASIYWWTNLVGKGTSQVLLLRFLSKKHGKQRMKIRDMDGCGCT
jgi:hypothetical protein